MRLSALWPSLLLVPLLAHGAPVDDPTSTLAQQRAQEAIAQDHDARGAAALVRLHALKGSLEDLGLLVRTDEKIAGDAKADPLVRTLAEELEVSAQQAEGHDAQVNSLTQKLGFMREWYVLGGFDNDGKNGCDNDFGPEKTLDLGAKYESKGATLSWHKLSQQSRNGYIDLGATLRPNQAAVGYALTYLKSDRARDVTLSLGTSGGYRLWVNGQLASKSDRYNDPRIDQQRLAITLRPGFNRVLLKVCQDHGMFGFVMREEPTAGIQSALPETPPLAGPMERPVVTKVLPTLADEMAQLLKAHPNDAHLLADQAVLLAHARAFDETEHADAVAAAKAAELAPNDVEVQLLAAELETRDSNVRRRFLEAALKADPSDPRALIALGEQELSNDHSDLARDLATRALATAPGSASARLLHARALEDLGDWPGAIADIEQALREHPRDPEVVHWAIHTSRRLNRPKEALERMRVAAALRFDDAGERAAMAGFLADLGQTDDAVRILKRNVQLFPFENVGRVRLAELLCANGKVDEGLRYFNDARALAPDEPDLYAREGQALLSAGRKDAAVASLSRALALRPQNPALKEMLRSLKGEEGALGEQYVFDVKSLVKEGDAYLGEDAVTLADYTYVRVQPNGLSARFKQLAVKVNSDRGVEAYRSFPITYSPDRQEVRVLRARITKPDGSVVESYGDADRNINDPSISMYYDTRAKVLSFPALAKGDVLELEFRIEDTASENLLSDYFGDVEYVQGMSPKVRYLYMVEMPQNRPLYWDEQRVGPGIATDQKPLEGGRLVYRWHAHDVSKITPEPGMPGWSEVASTLHVSTYKTWDQVANYFWGLVRDQLTPNDELKKTVDTVLKNVDRNDTRAVVKAIYDFVVTNTRYVALEFGIHGYKPYRVDQILARRFGDCKDKASLITAMLKLGGVDADMVLLRMRNLGAIGETPASLAPFNHAIAYVPKLDLFLDGTAEFHGADELPWVDHVAQALIVDPTGHGRFLTTPEAAATANQNRMSLEVALTRDGSAEVKGQSEILGENAPDYRRNYQAAATRKANFEQGWAQTFPGLSVGKLEISDSSALEQSVKLDYTLHVPRYAEADGGSLRFFPFGSTRQYVQSYASLSTRSQDLVMSAPWDNHFAFHYTLPAGLAPVSLPPEAKEETPFGHYALHCSQDGAKVDCEGEVALTVDRVKAADYAAFRAFLGRLDQAFGRKVTLTALPTQASAK
jgi:tetratricopeptide (TPR) repeat protein